MTGGPPPLPIRALPRGRKAAQALRKSGFRSLHRESILFFLLAFIVFMTVLYFW